MKMRMYMLTFGMLLSVGSVFTNDDKTGKNEDPVENILNKLNKRSKENFEEQKEAFDDGKKVMSLVEGIMYLAARKNAVATEAMREQAKKRYDVIKASYAYQKVSENIEGIADFLIQHVISQLIVVKTMPEIFELDMNDQARLAREIIRGYNPGLTKREVDKKMIADVRTLGNDMLDLFKVFTDLHHDCVDQYGESFCDKASLALGQLFSVSMFSFTKNKIDERSIVLRDLLKAQKRS